MNSAALINSLSAPVNTNSGEIATVETVGGVVRYRNIQARSWKRGGVVNAGEVRIGHHADVTPGVSIVLHGINSNHVDGARAYRREFKIGDMAEYDSFNLSYYGRIVAIGERTILIEERYGNGSRGPKTHRLDMHQFSWRNHDFDLEATAQRNADTAMYI